MEEFAQTIEIASPSPALISDGTEGATTPSLLAYPATYLLILLNLAVYFSMYRFGPLPALLRAHPWTVADAGATTSLSTVGSWLGRLFTTPFHENVLMKFGACATDRVIFSGQWWRLLTSIFVHVTLLHLLLNMWCLWNLGIFGEPLLGRPGLVAVYLITGAAGMLQSVMLSLLTGGVGVIVAGASGAIFGLAGILIILLSNRRLAAPWDALRSLRRQVAFFALANLLLGGIPEILPKAFPGVLRLLHLDPNSLPNIDNSAHLGGFLCGLGLGLPLFPRMTSGKSSYRTRQVLVFGTAALFLTLLSYALDAFARSLMRGGR